jgi:dolichyl-phosphate-mannose-protein mannosyltransferase
VYEFHTHFLNCATHVYGSKPSGWPLVNRPVGVATDLTIQPGQQGCTAAQGQVCYREVLLIGTPILWWGGCLALIFAGVMWIAARDWRWGVAIVGALSNWLPWLQYDHRPIFFFYAIAYLPFMVLAVVLTMGKLIGPSSSPSTRRTVGVVLSGSFSVLVLLNFIYFYPILAYQVIPRTAWLNRMWFARWI